MAVNPLLHKSNYLYFLLSLLIVAGMQVFAVSHFWQLPLRAIVIDAAVCWLLLGAVSYGLINTLSFYHPSRGKFLLVVLAPAVLAWAWLELSLWLVIIFEKGEGYRYFIAESRLYRLTVAYFILAGSMGFGLLWYRIGAKEDEQRRKEETERMAKEAELFKLRQQLQPHFLFNSLNSIKSLIGSRPQEARKMVQQLSEFLRGTMRREERKFISLQEELEYLQLYLDMEQVRFGHRLKVEVDCGSALQEWKIPPLILQPVLENAIKFGLYGTTDKLLIQLKCEAVERHLVISVSNPFDEDSAQPSGTGFGLSSIKRRLYLLYGSTALMEVAAAENQFSLKLKIPKIHDQSTDN